MGVSPINISRVTFRTNFVMDAVRRNQGDLLKNQIRISTGRGLVAPSDDPAAALQVFGLENLMARQEQFSQNIQAGSTVLTEADNAINEINALIIEAQSIASQNLSNLISADERAAEAELVAAIRQQLVTVGNREVDGRFIFAGRRIQSAPFVDAPGGVAYLGDTGQLNVRVAEGRLEAINVPGNELFGALSGSVSSRANLSPLLTAETRLEDLAGAAGRGVRAGRLRFVEEGGSTNFTVDIAPADTIADVTDLINRAARQSGSSVTASVGDRGLIITPGATPLSISDFNGGATAADLGIRTTGPITAGLTGANLGPRVTRLTPVEALRGGGGPDLAGGLRIRNGNLDTVVDLSQAVAVQDIINAINNAGVFVTARINDAGTAIDVFNQVSGTSMSIGEDTGTTAADLGLRTMDLGAPLAELNLGAGVGTVPDQPDLRITGKDGATSIEVDISGARTIGDVMDRINAAASEAGAPFEASLAPIGGMLITDTSGGDGGVSVRSINLSSAAEDLGLTGAADPESGALTGRDVHAARADGILDALVQLENALRGDDDRGITRAGERLERVVEDVVRVHGVVGARSRGMRDKLDQMQEAAAGTESLLSRARDVDFSEAITKLQAAQTVLQASLLTASRIQGLSLLDFIR